MKYWLKGLIVKLMDKKIAMIVPLVGMFLFSVSISLFSIGCGSVETISPTTGSIRTTDKSLPNSTTTQKTSTTQNTSSNTTANNNSSNNPQIISQKSEQWSCPPDYSNYGSLCAKYTLVLGGVKKSTEVYAVQETTDIDGDWTDIPPGMNASDTWGDQMQLTSYDEATKTATYEGPFDTYPNPSTYGQPSPGNLLWIGDPHYNGTGKTHYYFGLHNKDNTYQVTPKYCYSFLPCT
ncbi:MAG: hypothetical protein ACYC5F_08070 [Thermoleophilia bacterium]